MQFDLNSLVYPIVSYITNEVYPNVLAGEIATISFMIIALILVFIALVLLVELIAWLIGIVKRFLLFSIIAVSTALFLFSVRDKIFVEQPDIVMAAMGVAGACFAVVALIISVVSVKREIVKTKRQRIASLKKDMLKAAAQEFETEVEKEARLKAAPALTATQLQQPQMLTRQALHPRNILASFHDRSLLAVLSYMIVAEFGVISGLTVTAPSEQVGMIFFALFLVAALVFIKSTYHNYWVGLRHLSVALVFGFVLSVILGHIWIEIPLEQLLSLGYFRTNSLVAFVTGLAVSLFMGSKA